MTFTELRYASWIELNSARLARMSQSGVARNNFWRRIKRELQAAGSSSLTEQAFEQIADLAALKRNVRNAVYLMHTV
jgi:hypothetical protein